MTPVVRSQSQSQLAHLFGVGAEFLSVTGVCFTDDELAAAGYDPSMATQLESVLDRLRSQARSAGLTDPTADVPLAAAN